MIQSRYLLAVTLLFSSSIVMSMPILQVTGGILTGALNIDVDGTLYDVEFVDGKCTQIFDGCDDITDFTFQTADSATAASQALLDHVFVVDVLGDFDSAPNLTLGCEGGATCFTHTPYFPFIDQNSQFLMVAVKFALNQIIDSDDQVGDHPNIIAEEDFILQTSQVYAVWTVSQIPEPTALSLFMIGLMGLWGVQLKQKHSDI